MKKRNLLFTVFASIITLGIYYLYWYVSVQRGLKQRTKQGFGWFLHILLSLITFGIYSIYWRYAAGKRLAMLGVSDDSILYLILSIFLAVPIADLLIQNKINKLVG